MCDVVCDCSLFTVHCSPRHRQTSELNRYAKIFAIRKIVSTLISLLAFTYDVVVLEMRDMMMPIQVTVSHLRSAPLARHNRNFKLDETATEKQRAHKKRNQPSDAFSFMETYIRRWRYNRSISYADSNVSSFHEYSWYQYWL
jgi:hypothetical protein